MAQILENFSLFWHWQVAGFMLGDVLTSLGIFMVALAIRQLFSRLVLTHLIKLTEKTRTDMDRKIATALRPPLGFVPVIFGVYFALGYLDKGGQTPPVLDSMMQSLIVFTLFWAGYRLVDPLSFLLNNVTRYFTTAMVAWLLKAIKVIIALIGAAIILELWGIEIAPVLAGAGLVGVAIALGAQDLFKNLIAGILILAEKRYAIGDWVRVDGIVEGTVENIGFRSTLIRRFDMAPVYVPNTYLSDNAVTNFSNMRYRRIYWVIGLEYASTISQLRQIRERIEQVITENEAFVRPDQASTFVHINGFSDSAIDVMLYCFTQTTKWGEWLKIKEELALTIKNIVTEAGTDFAFPSRKLYVHHLPDDQPELFTPPTDTPEPATAKRGG